MNTVLQIPLSADLRTKSLISAREMGFSFFARSCQSLLNKSGKSNDAYFNSTETNYYQTL